MLCEYISKSQQANHNLHGKCSAYLITIIVTVWGSTECIYLRITAAYYTRSFLAHTFLRCVVFCSPNHSTCLYTRGNWVRRRRVIEFWSVKVYRRDELVLGKYIKGGLTSSKTLPTLADINIIGTTGSVSWPSLSMVSWWVLVGLWKLL